MIDLTALENVLLSAAHRRKSLTYGEVLRHFERRTTPILVAALCRDLGRLAEKRADEGAPDLACLVVRKSDGLPGEGYFRDLRDADGHRVPAEGPRAAAYVREQQERAFAYAAERARILTCVPD